MGGQKAQGAQAGQEEILAAFHRDELAETREPLAHGVGLHGQVAGGAVTADEGIGLGIETAKRGVVDPVLLHELELTFDVAVQADEQQPALLPIVVVSVGGKQGTVGAATAKQSMSIGRSQAGHRIGAERVTRIGAPYMCPNGAPKAMRVLREPELVGWMCVIARVGPYQRAIAPAADDARAYGLSGRRLMCTAAARPVKRLNPPTSCASCRQTR